MRIVTTGALLCCLAFGAIGVTSASANIVESSGASCRKLGDGTLALRAHATPRNTYRVTWDIMQGATKLISTADDFTRPFSDLVGGYSSADGAYAKAYASNGDALGFAYAICR